MQGETLKIDIDATLRMRAPGIYRFIPRGVVKWLERLVCQEQMNHLLEVNRGKTGGEFCKGVIETLNVKVDWANPDLLPEPNNRRLILVSNHPLGGLDGMALIHLVQSHFGGKVLFVVNDLLMAVKPLEEVFLPVSKFGKQSREALAAIEDAFAGDDPILIFPAGLCSRKRTVRINGKKTQMICDLDWQKMFIHKAMKHRRDIVPLYFNGVNSPSFYRYANLRKKLHIPFNLEQVLLPREVFRSSGKQFEVKVGEIIPSASIDTRATDIKKLADVIRQKTYRLHYGADTDLSL